jgi:hypothetical protein
MIFTSSIPIQLNMSVDSQHLGDDLPYQVFLGDKLTFQGEFRDQGDAKWIPSSN